MLSAPCPPELGCIVVLLCPYVLLHSDSYIRRKFVSSFVVIAITKHQRLLLHKKKKVGGDSLLYSFGSPRLCDPMRLAMVRILMAMSQYSREDKKLEAFEIYVHSSYNNCFLRDFFYVFPLYVCLCCECRPSAL